MSVHLAPSQSLSKRPPAPRASRRFALAFPLVVFIFTRIYAAIAITAQSHRQSALGPATKPGYYVHTGLPADPGYFGIITNWDGQWYQSIAADGYRVLAPGVPGALDALRAWAFPPIFPVVTGLVMRTGLSYAWAATLVNALAGAVAIVLLFGLLNRAGGRFIAMSGVSLLCCFVSAPLLQSAYSESFALLLLVGSLFALNARRYGWVFVAILALALTRIITPPLAIVIVVHAVVRWRHRREVPVPRKDVLALIVLALTAAAGALLWSGLARVYSPVSTGATSRPQTLTGQLGWFSSAYTALGWGGPVIVAVPLLALIYVACRPTSRAWGIEVRTWLWSYPLFIVAVTPITSGIVRYMLLCFPLGLVLAGDPRTGTELRRRGLVLAGACFAGLALQWWWVGASLVVSAGSWMP